MITQAAVKLGGVIYTLPKPARHHDILHDMYQKLGRAPLAEQGFLNDNGDFLNRTEAAKEALKCAQIAKEVTVLFSENLW